MQSSLRATGLWVVTINQFPDYSSETKIQEASKGIEEWESEIKSNAIKYEMNNVEGKLEKIVLWIFKMPFGVGVAVKSQYYYF